MVRRGLSSLCLCQEEGISCKGTKPIHEGSNFLTSSPSKGPTFKVQSHWGLGFQCTNLEGTHT